VIEERSAAVLELQTLLLESESESIVGGSEMVYSHKASREERKGTHLHVARLDHTLTS
jgi:hypothetical protein